MGFGFNLFFMFILVPLTGILLFVVLLSRKFWVVKTLIMIWLGFFSLILVLSLVQWLTAKTELDQEDYYGEYVINREYFPGTQTDWQYNHFRFEIKTNDSIFFYKTNKERVLEIYRGKIGTTDPNDYNSARLIIKMEQPTHHILTSNPTTYRGAWDFYLVFHSPKFYNVYFTKGKWKPLD